MSIDQGSRAIGGQCQIGAGVYPAIGVGEGEIYDQMIENLSLQAQEEELKNIN